MDPDSVSPARTKAIKHNRNPTLEKHLSSLDPELASARQGIDQAALPEGLPVFIKADSEDVINGQNNADIVFGRDRPGSLDSGYGSKGDTHCGRIDIVAGRLSRSSREFDITGKPQYTHPDFTRDAARIYISQKTDVDYNFQIKPDDAKLPAIPRSAIGIKADQLRLVAREDIKIVTGTDSQHSQTEPPPEGQPEKPSILSVGEIHLQAGNASDLLQPMVLGGTLAESLKELALHVRKLNGIVNTFVLQQMKYNKVLANHWHYSPFFTEPTTVSFVAQSEGIQTVIDQLEKTKKSLRRNRHNINAMVETYFKDTGSKYICSGWCKLN